MRTNCRRFLCFVLAAFLLAALLPASVTNNTAVADDTVFGKTIKENVNFRVGPSMGDKVLFKIQINTVVTVLGTVTANGYTWYKADARNPATNYVHTGYIRSDCFRLLSAEETAAYTGTVVTAAPAATPSASETSTDSAAAAGTIGYITNDGVNFRMEPNGTVIESLNKGTAVSVLTIPSVISAETWYKVEYNGKTGYIMSTFLNLNGTSNPIVTAAPATQTANPDALGYVMTIKGSVNIRASIGGTSLTTVGKWVTMPYLLTPVKNGNYTWYFVQVSATLKGYVRSDCVKIVQGPNGNNAAAPVVTTAPTAAPAVLTGYVATTMDYVNVRTGVWGNVIYVVQKGGTVFPFYSYKTVNNITWYYIYSPQFGNAWIHGNFVKVTDEGGSAVTPVPAVTSAPVVTAVPAVTATAAPATITGYVKTTVDDVNVRKDAWSTLLGTVKKKNTVMPYYGEPKVVSGNNWYYVNVPNVGYGYILGKFLKLTDDSGAAVTPTPTPDPAAAATPTPYIVNPNGGTAADNVAEASYTTLKSGSSGLAVQNLVSELKNQGYYTGALTSNYTSGVENAVRAFQKAKGLAVDGIAGSQTQHALYNTVPVGTANRTNMAMTLYPAEKIDWNTGGIQELWPRGANVKVYDVETGLVWWAHRWAGGLHIDAEPLTAADTAVLCKIYGVSSASQITESTHWQRRPCLVTIGTRTFACSLYGVPHNPDGNTIKDNNFNGQLCIHFTNSKTHGSSKVDSKHQEAIEYAYQNCPAGQKQ